MFQRAAAIVMSVVLAIGLAACGSDPKKSDNPTTTATKGTTTSTVVEVTTTSEAVATTATFKLNPTTSTEPDTTDTTEAAPVDNETFAQLIDEAQSNLDAANSDCDIRFVFDINRTLPGGANAAQIKLTVSFVSSLFNAIADSAPPAEAKNAAVWRAVAKAIENAAVAASFDPILLKNDKTASQVPGFLAARTAFTEATDDCPGATKI